MNSSKEPAAAGGPVRRFKDPACIEVASTQRVRALAAPHALACSGPPEIVEAGYRPPVGGFAAAKAQLFQHTASTQP